SAELELFEEDEDPTLENPLPELDEPPPEPYQEPRRLTLAALRKSGQRLPAPLAVMIAREVCAAPLDSTLALCDEDVWLVTDGHVRVGEPRQRRNLMRYFTPEQARSARNDARTCVFNVG